MPPLVSRVFLSHDYLWIVVLALIFDGAMGDPARLWTRLPHPVVLMGRLIDFLDSRLNNPAQSASARRRAGIWTLVFLVLVATLVGLCLQALCRLITFGPFFIAFLASLLIAQRSLYDHIARVREAFAEGGLADAREAVARVVGRDPLVLDEAGVCRAAIESCAENFSDGVVAPVFWLALLGLPGLIAYKIVNTADSMIGHRTPRYEDFGWAAARFDDVLNLIPARLSGLLLVCVAPVAGGHIDRAFAVMWQDAGQHRSPNAGWPESAAAGGLDLALAGPRQYAGQTVTAPFLNPAGAVAKPDDILRALRLLLAALGLHLLLYAVLALLI